MISTKFNQESSGIITFSFFNEDGVAASPISATWTLLRGGKIVNERNSQAFSSLGTSMDIQLSGDDLPAGDLSIVIEGTFNSVFGSVMPFREWATFTVDAQPRGA